MIIAITGNAGSGKTTIANIFANIFKSHSYKIINADKIGHSILKNNKEVIKKIKNAFGESVSANGRIDRNKLGNIVFSNKNKLNTLNKIVHPIIISEIKNKINQKNFHLKASELGSSRSQITENFFVDAALIFELKLENYFDYVIVVKCSEKNIIKRAGNKDRIKKILKNQSALKNKTKKADFVVDNNGSLTETKKQIKIILRTLTKSA